MLRIITTLALFAAAACASAPESVNAKQNNRAEVERERQQDRARHLQDEFNALTGD